jgi:hypothetical protein
MLQHDLVMTMSDQLKDRIENIVKSDRLSVLALGYYNMAVEFEHLKEVLYYCMTGKTSSQLLR